ncbi:MAG: redox-regulated ATPase YchF [Candidatus Nanoarchaeia archaeon]|nr:redox-regulated ATPase YchF [Candidatus Nanoarchaeia archaeon]MDD5357872.1 redox-regulated ATPase YchF [Candidatus Nanoarchaeia archaeon]MDD5588791.1 redox-regulated ATPase YchF [Candidatus Nanoarchaeia archaeon]
MLIGLVGKPSVGKSTFFKAATLAEVEIASYPFTTIKPNHGIGYVKVDCIDKEFKTQCNPNHGFCLNHKRFVPVDLMDVAGLVPGASEGKGLGNQFLDDLRQADVFIQIVDCSGTTDETGKPTENYDVTKDVIFLEDELDKWFLGILMKVWKSFARKIEMDGDDFAKAVVNQFSGLKVKEEHVKRVLSKLNFSAQPSRWNDKQLLEFASELRKQSKPMIIAANKIDTPDGKMNYEKLKKKFPEKIIIPCSADSELALREAAKAGLINYIPGERSFDIKGNLNEKQRNAVDKIKKNVLDEYETGTGIQEILNYAVFELLKYLAIFPAGATKLADSKGNILPDCFLLPPNSTALDFAFFLHTDFGKNFNRGIDARTKKILGRDYKLKNRDALEIVTGR